MEVEKSSPYGNYDLSKCVSFFDDEDGKRRIRFNLALIDQAVNDLAHHGIGYPPKFDNQEDRERAIRDVQMLRIIFETLIKNTDDVTLIQLAAQACSVGHNLGIEDAGVEAFNYFQRLLKLKPEDGQINYQFGAFLSSKSVMQQESLKYSQKAYDLGHLPAAYTLGATYITLGDVQKGLNFLRDYCKNYPEDLKAKQLVTALEDRPMEIQIKRGDVWDH